MDHVTSTSVVLQPNPDFVRARDADLALAQLAEEIDDLCQSGAVFCAPCRWYADFKPRVARLVGWDRHAPTRPRRVGPMSSADLHEFAEAADAPRIGDPWLYEPSAYEAVADELFGRLEAFSTPGCACETYVQEISEGLAMLDDAGREVARNPRAVDLTPFLEGTYTAPLPEVGGERDDGVRMAYSAKWHTLIAPTGAGKSWYGLWDCVAEMRAGRTVAYAHFEETSPAGTIGRLRALGCSDVLIRTRFVWLDCSRRWTGGEFAASLPEGVSLVVLDGINAACNHIGSSPDKPETVGIYRAQFVTPATAHGAAVLSLGHPPKARDRQTERHGFGSTAWLDEVDGVGFRLEPSKNPIRQGRRGASALYCVKDRYGSIERSGTPADSEGWTYLGSFVVDDEPGRRNTVAYLTAPKRDEEGNAPDALDALGEAIVVYAASHGGEWESARQLGDGLRADRVEFSNRDIAPAVQRLADRGAIELTAGRRGAVGGRLVLGEVDPFSTVS